MHTYKAKEGAHHLSTDVGFHTELLDQLFLGLNVRHAWLRQMRGLRVLVDELLTEQVGNQSSKLLSGVRDARDWWAVRSAEIKPRKMHLRQREKRRVWLSMRSGTREISNGRWGERRWHTRESAPPKSNIWILNMFCIYYVLYIVQYSTLCICMQHRSSASAKRYLQESGNEGGFEIERPYAACLLVCKRSWHARHTTLHGTRLHIFIQKILFP